MLMSFINENFMLKNKTAKALYFDYAKDMPIIDYHCHLNPKEAAENKHFKNLTELWLYGDHYKWRAMRCCGINEKYITGDASDFEKFSAYAEIMPYLIGNPLYHWTHLELIRYFGIDKTLCRENAQYIWDAANEQIVDKSFCVHNIFKKFKVEMSGTTDNPQDSLEYHVAYAKTGCETKLLPSFRPDIYINIELPPFKEHVNAKSYGELKKYLEERLMFFIKCGCKIADTGLTYIPYSDLPESTAEEAFKKAIDGKSLSKEEIVCYKFHIIKFLGELYAKHDIAMQIHYNALRNNNSAMFKKLGADTGFDSVNDYSCAESLSKLLDSMNIDGLLPKTILYSLNINDNYMLASMAGNFQSSEAKSKIQLGAGWWFNDQCDGMTAQLKALGNLGALGYFIGMLTDSRSFLSYPRHEYFRRILCSVIGEWVENGEYPYDKTYLEKIIKGISYENAKNYFGI